ncbi:MAG: DUF1232 domain-containing protein [Deltaproteobacteria bacterium]|nr:DUF1232 domain-containing protein [Deltaproteobacteria bacterium]
MMKAYPHYKLLSEVAQRLDQTPSTTDHLLLMRWKIMGLCQVLLGNPNSDIELEIVQALEGIAKQGVPQATNLMVDEISSKTVELKKFNNGTILPCIAPCKRQEVREQLQRNVNLGSKIIPRAAKSLPGLKKKLLSTPAGALLAGIGHRLGLVGNILLDDGKPNELRLLAAAAILYFEEEEDVIPDNLGPIGLLDDDFALRMVLEQANEFVEKDTLHWAEMISILWDELPFLRGVQLEQEGIPVPTTWLDRLNSYVAYHHSLNKETAPLVLVQPSTACAPIHTLISLMGLLVLEGLTTSNDLLKSLVVGRNYEIDGKATVRYEGEQYIRGERRLKLHLRDGYVFRLPTVADRMISCSNHKLTRLKKFLRQFPPEQDEPIQKFFNWKDAIGAANIPIKLAFVTSNGRVEELFSGICSNGISLIEAGLIRTVGMYPSKDEVRNALILVVPNLTAVRRLLNDGVVIQSIIVDGYDRLRRGRYDLPFIVNGTKSPNLIVWVPQGYFPTETLDWLPQHQHLQVSSNDLQYILELDGNIDDETDSNRASLWEVATRPKLVIVESNYSQLEKDLLHSIQNFYKVVKEDETFPEYWKYYFIKMAYMFQLLVFCTPAFWGDILGFGKDWQRSVDVLWNRLTKRAIDRFAKIRASLDGLLLLLDNISGEMNSKGATLLHFLSEVQGHWNIVLDKPAQQRVVFNFLDKMANRRAFSVILNDLDVCQNCIVCGWRSNDFARKVYGHAPRRLVALVDSSEMKNWNRIDEGINNITGSSFLSQIGYRTTDVISQHREAADANYSSVLPENTKFTFKHNEYNEPIQQCVFVWLAGEEEGKILSYNSRVLLEKGDKVHELRAFRISPDDKVILGYGQHRWSPADEFTQVVVKAIERSNPELVQKVREWRIALRRLADDRNWELDELKNQLEKVGVYRGLPTLNAWLEIETTAPIGPRHCKDEIQSIWKLVSPEYTHYSVETIASACSDLRSLRHAAGWALLRAWKGRQTNVGIDDATVQNIVSKVRQDVQALEVESISFGHVPESMLGWWITQDLASQFESTESFYSMNGHTIESNDDEDY